MAAQWLGKAALLAAAAVFGRFVRGTGVTAAHAARGRRGLYLETLARARGGVSRRRRFCSERGPTEADFGFFPRRYSDTLQRSGRPRGSCASRAPGVAGVGGRRMWELPPERLAALAVAGPRAGRTFGRDLLGDPRVYLPYLESQRRRLNARGEQVVRYAVQDHGRSRADEALSRSGVSHPPPGASSPG